jgi:SAM-dependent methyltransferase
VDVIVSSEVLEHVPDLHAAMDETRRVLRIGGYHVFTVPPRLSTQRRAQLVNGKVEHLVEPEYHSDPLSPNGILTYWDIGSQDGGAFLSRPGLAVEVAAGPEGRDGRIIWLARRIADTPARAQTAGT